MSTVYVYEPSAAIVTDPYFPSVADPTPPKTELRFPAPKPTMVFVSPASTSVSLASTFPEGLTPAMVLFAPLASTAVFESDTATMRSLLPRMTTKICADDDKPVESCME